MNKRVVINLKPSYRIVTSFKRSFPNATFYGNATLGNKSKSYLLTLEEFEERKEEVKKYGSKAKHQPFID